MNIESIHHQVSVNIGNKLTLPALSLPSFFVTIQLSD